MAAEGGQLDQGVNEDPEVSEAMSRLHPELREALNHQLAKSVMATKIVREDGFDKQVDLLRWIDGVNEKIDVIVATQIERKSGYLWARAGEDLMNFVTAEASLLSRAGMLDRIVMALKVFAMTKLREAAKTTSSVPFNLEEFERERVLHRIIEDILRGINTTRYHP